jgi:competence protein ComEC
MPPRPEVLRTTFLDVGQGDCVLVEWPGGKMMIDTGPSSRSGDAGRKVIVPYLRYCGVTSIDALLITHPDDDHLGGAVSVIDAITVQHVYRSGAWPVNQQTAAFDSILRERNIPVDQLHSGHMLQFNKVRMYVLSPDSLASTGAACNNTSIVLRVLYGNVPMLLTGDAENKPEGRMIRRYGGMLSTKLLKLGHHGSRTSSTEEFLDVVCPAEAVISCGRLNRFKHPHPMTLKRTACSGARIHRTDIEGAVIFETDGRSLWKVNWRN